MVMNVRRGIYRHYKGAQYEVLGTAKHSETEEELVIYRALYGSYGLWVRPKIMFTEEIQINGQTCQRFALMKAYED